MISYLLIFALINNRKSQQTHFVCNRMKEPHNAQTSQPGEDDFGQPLTHQCLLNSQSILSLQELHFILFDKTYNAEHMKNKQSSQALLNRKKSPTASTLSSPMDYNDMLLQANTLKTVAKLKRCLKDKYNLSQDIIRNHSIRQALWLLLSKSKLNIEVQPQYYEQLNNYKHYPQYYTKVIENDVKRTTTEPRSESEALKLSSVLKNLAKRNPYIGYCQGMNFIVNFLIMLQFDEEEAFWLAVALFEETLPKNYYTNMEGVAVDLKLVDALLKIQRPLLWTRLQELNINLSIFALQWLVCLFTTVLPYNVLMVLWDMLFVQGSVVLLKAIVIIVDQLAPVLERCQDFNQFLVELQPFKKKLLFEETSFIKKLSSIFIDKSFLGLARQVYCSLSSSSASTNSVNKKLAAVVCDPKWPICHQELHRHKLQQSDHPIWVFKEEGRLRVTENYLDLKVKNAKINREDNRDKEKRLVIGRTPHSCQTHSELAQGGSQSIQMGEYDPESNRYLNSEQMNDNTISMQFLRSASLIESTFIFNHLK